MTSEPSVIVQLWERFLNFFIYPEEMYFDNLKFSPDVMTDVRNLLIGLLLGVVIASFGMVYTKRVLGGFVRKLISLDALSPEKAVRLAETGYVMNFAVRNSLRSGNALRSVVRSKAQTEREAASVAEAEEDSAKTPKRKKKEVPEFRSDVDADSFYIPEDKKYQAEIRFEKKGTTWLGFAMIIIIAVAAFLILMALAPSFLRTLDKLAGGFDTTPDNIV